MFTFVGVITIEGRVLKCYPKYLLDTTVPKTELKQVLKVLEKYNSKEQIIRMYNDTSDSSAFNMLAVMLFLLQDYFEYGIYTNTQDIIESNGSGNILWDKTINETFTLLSNNRPYYPELLTMKRVNDDFDFFKRLHECILTRCTEELRDADLLDLFDIIGVDISDDHIEDFGDKEYVLERIVKDMAEAAQHAGVQIVTGDTKVVQRGACDRIFINTTGIGVITADPAPSGHNARPGDVVLVSGAMGDHGLTIMAHREGLSFLSDVQSDSAPLNNMLQNVLHAVEEVHVLRDPTRGGLATTLNEIAQQSGVSIVLEESAIPVHESVRSGCSFLGLDPLYLANEGKCICILPAADADAALEAMRNSPYGREAAIIGRVEEGKPQVRLTTPIGGQRLLGMLEGAQLPRIC